MKINTKLLRAFLLIGLSLFYVSVFSMAVSANDSVTVRVGLYENSPKIFTDDKGKASGFWPDIIEYIASQEGWKIEYVRGTWTQSLKRLERNEIEIMPDVAYTEERSRFYDFSNEIVYASWSRVYAKEGTDIKSILDFEGKTIAVLAGSVNVEGPEGIKELVRKFDINCSFIEVDSYTRVFELVESGGADVGVANRDFANQHLADFNLVRTAIIFQPASLYFAFPKGSSLTPHLIERIDYHMKELKEDGGSIYYQSLEKRLGVKPTEKSVVAGWIIWTLAGIGGLALLLAVGSFILRSQVRSRTRGLTEEITERKRAEEQTRRLQDYLQLQVDRMPIALIVWDTDFQVLSWNPAAEKIFGFSVEEAVGKHPYDIVVPKEAQPQVDDIWRRLLEGDATAHSINDNITKDGRTIICEWTNTPLKKDDGTVVGVLSMAQDITERKQAEERIEHLTTVLRAVRGVNQLITREKDRGRLIQKSCDLLVKSRGYELAWVLLIDAQGNFSSAASAGAKERFSVLVEQMKRGEYPHCARALLTEEDPFVACDDVRKQHKGCPLVDLHQGGGGFACRLEYDGKVYGTLSVDVPSEITLDKEEQGLFRELCGDISFALDSIEREEERQRAEERLRESEANLAEAQRIAHLGNWVWDIKNNTIDWSEETYRIFGSEPQQFSPTYETFLDRVHPDDREYVQASLFDYLYEKKSYNIEHRILRPDASIRMVREIGEVLLDEEGEPVKMFGTVHDITELREAEAKALEAEALKELERLRSGFMASVSHELRTPLASIKGFVSTLLRTDTKWSEEEQRDFLQTIDLESDRLTRLINDLLDISRIEAGALKLKKANFSLAEILDSNGPRLARLTEHHQLKTAVPSDLPPVFVDEMRIGQVLTNLVENATKYSSEGSEITIEARLEGDHVIISVTDRGEGIPAELLDKIFDRFYQAESIVTGRKSGTGLGLAICRGILEAHGGKIWVESKLGEGSKFSFSLPVSKGEEQDAEGSGG